MGCGISSTLDISQQQQERRNSTTTEEFDKQNHQHHRHTTILLAVNKNTITTTCTSSSNNSADPDHSTGIISSLPPPPKVVFALDFSIKSPSTSSSLSLILLRMHGGQQYQDPQPDFAPALQINNYHHQYPIGDLDDHQYCMLRDLPPDHHLQHTKLIPLTTDHDDDDDDGEFFDVGGGGTSAAEEEDDEEDPSLDFKNDVMTETTLIPATSSNNINAAHHHHHRININNNHRGNHDERLEEEDEIGYKIPDYEGPLWVASPSFREYCIAIADSDSDSYHNNSSSKGNYQSREMIENKMQRLPLQLDNVVASLPYQGCGAILLDHQAEAASSSTTGRSRPVPVVKKMTLTIGKLLRMHRPTKPSTATVKKLFMITNYSACSRLMMNSNAGRHAK